MLNTINDTAQQSTGIKLKHKVLFFLHLFLLLLLLLSSPSKVRVLLAFLHEDLVTHIDAIQTGSMYIPFFPFSFSNLRTKNG